ncbi:MAG: hypothetical protein AB7S81_00705 [Bdellovibrionales bacterium]
MADKNNTSSPLPRTLSPEAAGTSPKTQGQPSQKQTVSKTVKAVQAPTRPRFRKTSPNYSTTPFWVGVLMSVAWIGSVVFAMLNSSGMNSFAGIPLTNWAIGISAIISPVAMIWMVAAYLQRAADVQSVTEPLRRQLAMITGESGAAEIRVRRFNQAIKEQLDLLKSTKHIGDGELMAIIERVNAHKADLEEFEQHSLYQVKEIQDVIHRSMDHIESLMDDKFTMLRVLDGKLVQNGDKVAEQAESMREKMTHLLEDIEKHAETVAGAVEQAMRNTQKLSDTARSQETSLLNAAETASSTLQEVSGRIDTDIAHFLGRTGLAREEAERLAAALDTQTRSLDELSSLMPARIGEAESVLRGVADRLYASEQLAREQAAALAETLEEKTGALETFLKGFTSRINEVDATMKERQTDLDGIVTKLSGAGATLGQQLENSITELSDRADSVLASFSETNEKARRSTNDIAAQLEETAARYEEATSHLETVSDANREKLKELSTEMGTQIEQFNTLHKASEQAGNEVHAKAAKALENLQAVLDKLMETRNATQSVGDILSDKLMKAATDNEGIISRIHDAAQSSIQALSIATESLTRQEGDITEKAQKAETTLRSTMAQIQHQAETSERAMRSQNDTLTALLDEMKARLDSTDQRLQDFADTATAPVQEVINKIDESTEKGRESLTQYGSDLHSQLDKLQLFNSRIGEMGLDVGKMTSDTLSSIEDLNRRFEMIRKDQDETTSTAVEQFNSMAARLQSEVDTLGNKAGEAATTLQEAAKKISEQSRHLSTETQDSGTKISAVTSVLQNEAKTIRLMLEQQSQEIHTELSKAGERFQTISHDLKDKTEEAYKLLDRVADHYADITNDATTAFEDRAANLNERATSATDKIVGLSSAIEKNLSLISDGAERIKNTAGTVNSSSDKTVDRLEQLSTRLSILQNTAVEETDKVVNRMQSAADKFRTENESLRCAANDTVECIQKSALELGEQASHMMDVTSQVESSIKTLSQATSSFAGQSAEIRTAMEDHNGKLIAALKDTMAQLDTSNMRLQETAAGAIVSADNATSRYDELASKTSSRLEQTSGNILKIANDTDVALESLSANVTKQVAALNIVSEQIAEQHKMLNKENEHQHDQMMTLFDKLGEAHKDASGVAERTIKRLDDTLAKVQDYLGQLSDHSQTTLASVTIASDGFAGEADKLVAHAQQAEEQARTAMTVTSTLQKQAKELSDALHSEANRTSDMLTSLLARLASGSDDIHNVTDKANTALGNIQDGITRQASSLNETMSQIATRQDALSKALDTQRETLSSLITRLASASDDTATAAEDTALRLTEGTNKIVHQLEKLDNRTQESLSTIAEATSGFARESETLAEKANTAEKQTLKLLENTMSLGQQATSTEENIKQAAENLSETTTQLEKAGKTVESSLGRMADSVAQSTAALNENMTQVAERQNELGTALDAQREMLGGMVTRLTLAQDETAAAAERSAARLSDSTGQITREMKHLDEQTQNALAAIRAAGSSLSDESASLTDHTQKAETKIRDMLKTTGDLHEETTRIRQTIKNESDQVIDQVRTVMTQLEISVGQLKEQGGQVQNLVDKSALDLGEISQKANDVLKRNADQLSETAQKAQKDIGAVNEKIIENSNLIENASNLSQEHGAQLAATAEHATSRLVDLITRMNESDSRTQEILTKADKRLTETRNQLEVELKNIADLSAQAVEQVMGAGSTLAIQSDALRANLASSESALSTAADTVREETSQLPALMGRSTKAIESAAADFKAKTGDMSDTLLKTTDRCISATGAIRDTMMDEAKNLEAVTAKAGQTLKLFNEAMMAQIKDIKESTGEISSEQKLMVESATQTIMQLSAASDRLSQLHGNAAQTTSKLAHDFETIELRAAETTKRLAKAGDNMSTQVAHLISMAEKAEGQMGKASKSFREQLEAVRSGVQTQIEDINRGLMQITAQLDRTGTSLRSALAGTVVDVEKIANRFDKTSKDTTNQLTDRTARMRAATEEVGKLLNGFGTQIDVLLDRLGMAGDGIKRHEGDLTNNLQHAFKQLGEVAERLDSTRVLSTNVSDAAVSKLDEVSKMIEKQIRSMAEGGEKVAGIIQNVAQTYTGQTQKVNSSVIESQEEIINMGKAMEEMQQRTDRMRVTLKLQADDLMDSMETLLSKLSGAGDAMSDAVDTSMQRRAAESLKKIWS